MFPILEMTNKETPTNPIKTHVKGLVKSRYSSSCIFVIVFGGFGGLYGVSLIILHLPFPEFYPLSLSFRSFRKGNTNKLELQKESSRCIQEAVLSEACFSIREFQHLWQIWP